MRIDAMSKISPEAAERVGEVVRASTTAFDTQCHRLYEAPPLGALVRCGSEEAVYGVVADVTTQSLDPGRQPIARGHDEDTEEGVYASNPQLTRLLATQFTSIAVGYGEDGRTRRYIGPHPPRIHAFVYVCQAQELRDFSAALDFLSILLAAPVAAQDDVTASFLRQASRAQPDPERFLVAAGKEVAALLANETRRLNGILRRLST